MSRNRRVSGSLRGQSHLATAILLARGFVAASAAGIIPTALLLSATVLSPSVAMAQPLPMPLPPRWPPQVQSSFDRTPRVAFNQPGKSLRERLGVEVARSKLVSEDPRERMRAVERLGTLGDAPALDALLESVDSGSSRDPDARLHAIRMLAPHASETRVRAFLTRELLGGSAGKASLVRSTAAMALAKAGDDKALSALALALDQRGPASEAAEAALLAYPPATLDPFLLEPREEGADDDKSKRDDERAMPRPVPEARARETKKPSTAKPKRDRDADTDDEPGDDDDDEPSPKKKDSSRRQRTLTLPMIDFLGRLGDLRALPALRAAAARKQVTVKARAGLALARFGDPSGLADAREWTKGDDLRLLVPAAETLVLADDPTAAAALKKLLSNKDTRSAALSLLFGASKPALFTALHTDLEKLAKDDWDVDRAKVVMALGRVSVSLVDKLLDGSVEVREAAAMALATAPGEPARTALDKRIRSAKTDVDRRLALRAAVVRQVVLGDAPEGLEARLGAALSQKDDVDRELGALGLVATGWADAATVLARAKPAKGPHPTSVIAGAARGAMLHGGDLGAFGGLLAPLEGERDTDEHPTLRQIAAGVSLLDADAASQVPERTLLAWAEGGGALAPLAARALGARDDDDIRARLRDLLRGTDPVIRAHTAMGLALDPEPSAVTLLSDAYLVEDDASVRRATIEALAQRSEPQRTRVLTWASELDPDEGVRRSATLALEGHALERGGRALGATLALTRIMLADGTTAMTAARYRGADEIAFPVVSSPDGALLVPAPAYGATTIAVTLDTNPLDKRRNGNEKRP